MIPLLLEQEKYMIQEGIGHANWCLKMVVIQNYKPLVNFTNSEYLHFFFLFYFCNTAFSYMFPISCCSSGFLFVQFLSTSFMNRGREICCMIYLKGNFLIPLRASFYIHVHVYTYK